MSVTTITNEIASLLAAVKRAKQKAEALGFVHDAEFDAVANAAITAVTADPANSTSILSAAETKFSRYASADHLSIRQARATSAGIAATISDANAQAGKDAAAAAIAAAVTAANAPVVALQATAAKAGVGVETITRSADVVAASQDKQRPDRLAKIGRDAAAAVLRAAMAPAHEALLAV